MNEGIGNIFIGKARKYNRYIETDKVHKNRSCMTCIRKYFSYPYTCNEGWSFCCEGKMIEKGETCLNWTDDRVCKVD